MRRNRFVSRARQSADADTLTKLARRLSESSSRIEDRLWERRLSEVLYDRLARGFDAWRVVSMRTSTLRSTSWPRSTPAPTTTSRTWPSPAPRASR